MIGSIGSGIGVGSVGIGAGSVEIGSGVFVSLQK